MLGPVGEGRTKPELSRTLFDGSVQSHKNSFANWLNNAPAEPYVVTSDVPKKRRWRFWRVPWNRWARRLVNMRIGLLSLDRPKPCGALLSRRRILSPCWLRRTLKRHLPGGHKTQHTIIVRRRNAVEGQPDIALDLVDDETFKKGLLGMSFDEEEVRSLSRASGQSLTILRRRLSEVPAIKVPPWANDSALTRKLIPLGFAGAWDSTVKGRPGNSAVHDG